MIPAYASRQLILKWSQQLKGLNSFKNVTRLTSNCSHSGWTIIDILIKRLSEMSSTYLEKAFNFIFTSIRTICWDSSINSARMEQLVFTKSLMSSTCFWQPTRERSIVKRETSKYFTVSECSEPKGWRNCGKVHDWKPGEIHLKVLYPGDVYILLQSVDIRVDTIVCVVNVNLFWILGSKLRCKWVTCVLDSSFSSRCWMCGCEHALKTSKIVR